MNEITDGYDLKPGVWMSYFEEVQKHTAMIDIEHGLDRAKVSHRMTKFYLGMMDFDAGLEQPKG